MYTSETPGGRERRKHPRYNLRRPVRILIGDFSRHGELIDISVGGAAIACRAVVPEDLPISVEIEGLGTYPAVLVRRINPENVAIRFTINEALAVRLAARISVALHEGSPEREPDIGLETIELLPRSN